MKTIADEISSAEYAWRTEHKESPKILRLSHDNWEALKAHCLRIADKSVSGPHQKQPVYAGMNVEVVPGVGVIGFARPTDRGHG